MKIQPNEDVSKFDHTFLPAKPVDKSSVFFWFKRSDFYVVGMDFVFSRIALICQSTAIAFYLQLVCGYSSGEGQDTPYQMALAPAIAFLSSLLYSVLIMDKL